MEIKRSNWNLYQTELAVKINCPKCSLKTYAHVHEYGPEFSKYLNNKLEEKVYCPRCGTEWTVKLVEDDIKPELLKINSLYAVTAKDPRSTVAERGAEYAYIDKYVWTDYHTADVRFRVVYLRDKKDDGCIISCGTLKECSDYFRKEFNILEDLNEPIQNAGVYINTLLEEEKKEEETKPYRVTISDEEIEETLSTKEFTPKSGIWYDVSTHNYLDDGVVVYDKDLLMTDSIYLQHLGSGDCYNLILHLKDGWNKVIEHCASLEICCDTINEYFNIEKESDDQDKPIKEDTGIDRRVRPDELGTNKVYEVRATNRCGIYGDIKFISVNRYCPTVNFDDNYTDEWYNVWGGKTDKDVSKKIYDNATLEDCKGFIFNYFHVMEIDNV